MTKVILSTPKTCYKTPQNLHIIDKIYTFVLMNRESLIDNKDLQLTSTGSTQIKNLPDWYEFTIGTKQVITVYKMATFTIQDQYFETILN